MDRLLYVVVALGMAALGHVFWKGFFVLLCVWLVAGLIVEVLSYD